MDTITQEQQERRLLRNTLFLFFVSGMGAQPLGSFIPFLRETYGFSYDLSGILLSCQSVGNLVAILITGFLPIWLGRRKSGLVTAVWMAVSYLIFASGIGTPAMLIAACLMNGVARGGNSTFTNSMVATLPGEKSTRGLNLLHGTYAVGALLSPLLLIVCTGRWPVLGWRLMAGFLCLLCLIQLGVYARMPLPAEKLEHSLKAVDYSFLKVKEFWLGSAMLVLYVSMEYATMGWLVTYFQDIGLLNADHSQMMNSLLWLVIFAGRMTGACLTGRVSRNRILLADGMGLFVFFLLMFFSRTTGLIILGLVGSGFFMATIYPTALAFGSSAIRGNDLGCSVMILAGSVGGVITPALVGFVAESAGIRVGMGLIAAYTGLLLAAIVVSVWSVREKKREN